jgi:hypothetical protein
MYLSKHIVEVVVVVLDPTRLQLDVPPCPPIPIVILYLPLTHSFFLIPSTAWSRLPYLPGRNDSQNRPHLCAGCSLSYKKIKPATV